MKSSVILAAACLCLLLGQTPAWAGESDYSPDDLFQNVEDFARSLLGMEERAAEGEAQKNDGMVEDMAPVDTDANTNSDADEEAATEDSMLEGARPSGPPVVAKAGGG